MPYPSLTFAAMLDNATRQELEQFISLLQGYLSVEHKEDGTHSAITADSVTTTGAITGGSTGAFTGDVTALDGSGKECAIGILSTVNGTAFLTGEATRWGALLAGTTGHFLEHRTGQTPFTSGNEIAVWNLGFSTTKPVVRIGVLSGVITLLDGGTGTSLSLGDSSTRPLASVATTALILNGSAIGTWTAVTYAAGNFTSDTGAWTVASGDQTTYAYTLTGKTMTLALTVSTASITGTPNQLRVAIPGSATSARSVALPALLYNNGAWTSGGVIEMGVGATYLALYKNDYGATNWAASTDTHYLRFVITFEIQ